ncbi:WhiB family transcriptional regulator [Kitasatospora saccharophila]|uniref:WhiB family transcriptional regulator n=1 Tax=Kitasatospora saccharophila TaxID=407973 RepID=UPI00363BC029
MQLPHFVPRTDSTTGVLPCVGNAHLFDEPGTADQAAELCARCPIRTACDTWATTHREWGTWAGRTDEDRGTPAPNSPTDAASPATRSTTTAAPKQPTAATPPAASSATAATPPAPNEPAPPGPHG